MHSLQARAMKRLECLDGLRGVLAVYVLLGHMAPFAALPGWIVSPLAHGGAAVDVFFILSGLVIFRSLESCRFQAASFLILRTTRIFPVFLAMLAAAIALQPLPAPFAAMPWIGPDGLARDIIPQGWPANWAAEIAAHLTMMHGLFPNGVLPDAWNSFLAAGWSLSTEWQFYVLALLLGRTRMDTERLVTVFLLLAALGLAWDTAAPEAWRFSRAFLPNKAQYFALGIASAVWADRR
jgi:peptidoglycan/LPS O-acetylase OafA/YrhL